MLPHKIPLSNIENRRLARQQQEQTEAERFRRHADLASVLLTSTPEHQLLLISEAKARVTRWRERRLCSEDYITRWEAILALPVEQMAQEIVGDCSGWGRALRQNTPFSLKAGGTS